MNPMDYRARDALLFNFEEVLSALNDIEKAREFIEFCEANRVTISNSKYDGPKWDECPDHIIINLAKNLAGELRKMWVIH